MEADRARVAQYRAAGRRVTAVVSCGDGRPLGNGAAWFAIGNGCLTGLLPPQRSCSGQVSNAGVAVASVALVLAAATCRQRQTASLADRAAGQQFERGDTPTPRRPWQKRVVVASAAELAAAFDRIDDVGSIEIDTGATLSVPPLSFDGKSATLAAAKGRRPTLPLALLSEVGPPTEYTLRMHYGTLSLVGLTLNDRSKAEAHARLSDGNPRQLEAYSLLSLIDDDLKVGGCRREARAFGACIELEPVNAMVVRNTAVAAPERTAVALHAIALHAIDRDELVLTDCVVLGSAAMVTDIEGEADLVLQHSTVVANHAAMEFRTRRGRLSARVSGCLIQSPPVMILSSVEPPSLDAFEQKLARHGDGNRIHGHDVIPFDEEFEPRCGQEVTNWAVADRNSTYRRTLFSVPRREVVQRLLDKQPIADLVLEQGRPKQRLAVAFIKRIDARVAAREVARNRREQILPGGSLPRSKTPVAAS